MRSLFLILLLVGLAAPAATQYKGRVIGGAPAAFDGDTLLVKPESAQPVSVRLWGIDTSEMKGAPWGRQARGALTKHADQVRGGPLARDQDHYCRYRLPSG